MTKKIDEYNINGLTDTKPGDKDARKDRVLSETCSETHFSRYICTRSFLHRGLHIAARNDGTIIARWN